jgi:hypothetical protein
MKIPQGFVVDAEIKGPYGDYMTLSRKGNGYVTVDFKGRRWTSGSGLCGPYYAPTKTLPRQFRQALVDEACSWFLAQYR